MRTIQRRRIKRGMYSTGFTNYSRKINEIDDSLLQKLADAPKEEERVPEAEADVEIVPPTDEVKEETVIPEEPVSVEDVPAEEEVKETKSSRKKKAAEATEE